MTGFQHKIAFIGTGSMGRPMILKLLAAGYEVSVYDKYLAAAESVVAAGAKWCGTPRAAAADCGLIVTNLPLPHHVLENMLGDYGALTDAREGAVWIDFSTTDYHNTLDIAAEAARRGVASLEAPVSNLSHMGVDFANVSFFVGGPADAYGQWSKTIDTMGKISFHVGAIGQAQSVKLLTNLCFYTAALATGDAFIAAAAAGIPPQIVWERLKQSPAGCVAIEQFMPFLLDGSYDTSCTLEITVKDMGLTVALADELGVALPIGRLVERGYATAGQMFDAQKGHLQVIRRAEIASGWELRIPDYIAPSRYGADPRTPIPTEFQNDSIGRIKPVLIHRYERIADHTTAAQEALLCRLVDLIETINFRIYEEAVDLGRGMGLDDRLIHEVITWSVGTSDASDRLTEGPAPAAARRPLDPPVANGQSMFPSLPEAVSPEVFA